MELIKSISGIRGIFNKSLNIQNSTFFSKKFTLLQQDGPILLARDTRPHGKQIYDNIIKSLNKIGRDVISCNIIPTPTAQYIIKQNNYAGGIVVTASHNPIEWNGLKFLDNDGCFLNERKMINVLDDNSIKEFSNHKGKTINYDIAILEHIKNVENLKCINTKKIKNKKFKIVVDTVNGAAYKALPLLLEKFNCEVVKIHCSNTGTFPRGTEPIPSHLKDLSHAVKIYQADIGFATDPDADRLAIVDNYANPIGEESTLVLALESYLKYYKNNQQVVTNLSTSMAIDFIAEKYGSKVKRSSVGEINVVEKMKKLDSKIGGEGNGGVILEESHLGRDSLVAAALVLSHLAQSNTTLNNIIGKIPSLVMIKDKITLQDDINFNHIKTFFQNEKVTYIENDGLKVIWEDKWIHIRKSNTEPIIRVISEACNHKLAKDLIDTFKKHISS